MTVFTPITLAQPDGRHVVWFQGQSYAYPGPGIAAEAGAGLQFRDVGYEVIPEGGTYSDRYWVVDPGTYPVAFRPFPTDYITTDGQTLTIPPAGTAGLSNDAGLWWVGMPHYPAQSPAWAADGLPRHGYTTGSWFAVEEGSLYDVQAVVGGRHAVPVMLHVPGGSTCQPTFELSNTISTQGHSNSTARRTGEVTFATVRFHVATPMADQIPPPGGEVSPPADWLGISSAHSVRLTDPRLYQLPEPSLSARERSRNVRFH